ncbi:MAG: NAD(+) synthase [Betaproteobacteria bacterium]|nr:NAD(+) synthase [Betaproteobacteria bacterium]
MTALVWSPAQIRHEIERVTAFLQERLGDEHDAVLGLSGGIDSDVTARLLVRAVGVERVRFFTVVQADMEDRHLRNARALAKVLGVPLVELPLATWAWGLIDVLATSDPDEGFSTQAFLDVGRAKNSLRSVVYSTYHDRGYITVGTSNRTEAECGFFVRFGDGLWHLGPIAHLYKTQVFQLAAMLGSTQDVIQQPASAGYWQGQSDLEDLAYWMIHGAPIGAQRSFSPAEIEGAAHIHAELSFERLDQALNMIAGGETEPVAIARAADLSTDTAARLRRLVIAAKRIKGYPVAQQLDYPVAEVT